MTQFISIDRRRALAAMTGLPLAPAIAPTHQAPLHQAFADVRAHAAKLLRTIAKHRTSGGPGNNAYWILDTSSTYVQALAPWSHDAVRLEMSGVAPDELLELGFSAPNGRTPNAWLDDAMRTPGDQHRLASIAAYALLSGAAGVPPRQVRSTLKLPGRAPVLRDLGLTVMSG
jgi:hypothetical protein